MVKKKELKTGYTTGACAAAAAKAAAMLLMSSKWGVQSSGFKIQSSEKIKTIEIPFPDGSRVSFKIKDAELRIKGAELTAKASIIKNAGDDPDVTNKAEITAEVSLTNCGRTNPLLPPFNFSLTKEGHRGVKGGRRGINNIHLIIKGGSGVGMVTKPGLPVPVGEPAINPVPMEMIREAVEEAVEKSCKLQAASCRQKNYRNLELILEVIISVIDGERLAKKTLNPRLGIIGGISILGTTGIVHPLSSEAWTETIKSQMNVAKASGCNEIVLSTGRTSEKAHLKRFNFPEEAYVMMGDYLEFALLEAKKLGFKEIHLCAQWGKTLKIAMGTPQTHVKYGAINPEKTTWFLNSIGIHKPEFNSQNFNTAREIYDFINSSFSNPHSTFLKACNAAKRYAESIASKIAINVYLVSYKGEIIEKSK